MATPPPPPSASGAGGQPGSVEALASLLGIPLGGGDTAQPGNNSTGQALSQLLQLVQQQQAVQRAAAAPAPQPPPQEQPWQQPQQAQPPPPPPPQQAWQPQAPASAPHEALLAALLQSAQQPQLQPQQPQQPAPLAFQQPAPQHGFAPLLLTQLAQQAQAPPAAAPPPLPAFQPQEGHSRPSRREGATDGVAAGRKVRVSCNDVPGVLHIDSLYVACECRDCDARVRLGHDRPIFGLSRWEKHCGSKAKKWRISLRVVPGSCPEVKLNDPPMAVGTWLDLKGIHVTGTGERIGMDVEVPFAGIAAKRARLPSWAGEGAFEQAGGMEAGGSPGGAAAAAAAAAADASVAQEPLELALLDSAAPEGSMSEAFLRQQQRVFAELRAGSSDGNAAQRQHVAIFGLAAALLEGPAQHLLSEAYLPYINDLSGEHLARQTSTFGCYLDLLGQGMEWQAVHRQLMAFMRGTLRRILSRRPQTSGPAAEGEDGAAAEGAKPSASSPARPTTGPSAAAADQERDLPASGSTLGMGEGAADAGEQAPVDSSSRGTGSVEAGRQEQQPAAAAVKQESEPAAGTQAAGAAASAGVTAGGGVPAAEGPGAAGPVPAAAGQAPETAGNSGPAFAGVKAEPKERAAAPTSSAGGHERQREGAEQAAAAAQSVRPAGTEPAV